MSENNLNTAIVRSVYLFVVYTGIRAVSNRVRSVFLPVPHGDAITETGNLSVLDTIHEESAEPDEPTAAKPGIRTVVGVTPLWLQA